VVEVAPEVEASQAKAQEVAVVEVVIELVAVGPYLN
jgi:hypothetical protein